MDDRFYKRGELPRDIYDLWCLSKRKTPLDFEIINKKLKFYRLVFDTAVFHEKLQQKRNMWTSDLKDLIIGTLPSFDDVIADIEEYQTTWL